MKTIPENFSPAPDCLKGKVILVTGAGSGIGKVAATTFARHGASVVLLGRRIHTLEQTYDQIVAEKSPQPAIYPLNMEGANAKDYADLVAVIQKEFGQLNGLLHNAAVLGNATPIQHYNADTWLKVMQINVNAAFMLTRECIPLMQTSKDPRIVFTTHKLEAAYWGAYAVSKAAVESLMKMLAVELDTENPIRVNAIEPGEVNSPMNVRAYPGKLHGNSPSMESIMPAYLYLIDTISNDVNGEIINT